MTKIDTLYKIGDTIHFYYTVFGDLSIWKRKIKRIDIQEDGTILYRCKGICSGEENHMIVTEDNIINTYL